MPARHLVLMHPFAGVDGVRELNQRAGIRVGNDADVSGPITARRSYRASRGFYLSDLDVAVVNADPDQAAALARGAREPGPIAFIEPERTLRVRPVTPPATGAGEDSGEFQVPHLPFTWGLQAVGAAATRATGKGVRLAVLDTGIDMEHPDFVHKLGIAQSFVADETTQDVIGHGTHCAGIATGPRTLEVFPGYGVAPEANLYVAKTVDKAGEGQDGAVLSAIAWAVRHKCAVVSISLGSPVRPDEFYSVVFEQVAARALRAGTLIVAAAGNDSDRVKNLAAPVDHPANCPSVLAVGAIGQDDTVAPFSNMTVNLSGGAVDVAAPGVDVFSAWIGGYRTLSGTSMATPHVAGVAALLSQATGARGWELWARLQGFARRLEAPSRDVGAGLVQAPR
ncbi:S8 family serine peptidase [Amycolatopsis sp. DSM 110486]|uniref:S8 family serine peptidase n=1 Tax=Amycolatopsis sp. DSM 110486 TaxID=2865832 RepID=UPI0021076250|nr:S8 family serine peptidase [Amycolatopsis sp. DSM 110486]